MNSNDEKKVYMPIGSARLLNITVFIDGEVKYNGMVENASDDIKKLKYSKVIVGNPMLYYVYSELNK